MSLIYRRAAKPALFQRKIEKSLFIARVFPLTGEKKAETIIQEIREAFCDATHHVPAFILGDGGEYEKMSDDGEPTGTAGLPVLNALKNRSLTYTLVIVTRYFGGIKLGTGGLARAYGGLTGAALDQAGYVSIGAFQRFPFRCDYKTYQRISRPAHKTDFALTDVTFGSDVLIYIECDGEKEEKTRRFLTDISAGSACLGPSIPVRRVLPAE